MHTNTEKGKTRPKKVELGKWYELPEYRVGDRVHCVVFRTGKIGSPGVIPELRELEVTHKYPEGYYGMSEEGIMCAEDMFTDVDQAAVQLIKYLDVCISYHKQEIETCEKMRKGFEEFLCV